MLAIIGGLFQIDIHRKILNEVLNPDFAVDVVAILRRKHIHKYVEEQNRETNVAARIFKPQ